VPLAICKAKLNQLVAHLGVLHEFSWSYLDFYSLCLVSKLPHPSLTCRVHSSILINIYTVKFGNVHIRIPFLFVH
jgi:hypothetical protein